jgi:hypothetical protein
MSDATQEDGISQDLSVFDWKKFILKEEMIR